MHRLCIKLYDADRTLVLQSLYKFIFKIRDTLLIADFKQLSIFLNIFESSLEKRDLSAVLP